MIILKQGQQKMLWLSKSSKFITIAGIIIAGYNAIIVGQLASIGFGYTITRSGTVVKSKSKFINKDIDLYT